MEDEMGLIALYGTATQLWDRSVGLRAALWFNAMLLIGIGAILSTPDSPSSYDVNAELSFYLKDRAPVRQITERQRYRSVPADSVLATQRALLVLSVASGGIGRFKRCFEVLEPISLVSRDGPQGPIDHFVVESALNAQPKIMSAGCSFHEAGHHLASF
jgi:hypothetical protein